MQDDGDVHGVVGKGQRGHRAVLEHDPVDAEAGCVGSLAGIYTASMPVFVVENRAHGNTGYCNMYEGTDPRRLNYGVYDDDLR